MENLEIKTENKFEGLYIIGYGLGGLVVCSILAECVCPLLPNPCYK
jgi:hypothetical protein